MNMEGLVINDLSNLWGYEDTLESDKAASVIQTLTKQHCYTLRDENDADIGVKVISEAEFIADCIRTGREPEIRTERDCVACPSFVCNTDETCERSKMIFCMADIMLATQITDAGYGFADYLISGEFITVERKRVKPVIAPVKTGIEPVVKVVEPPLSETEYDSWLKEAALQYANTPESAKLVILKEIFLDMTGSFEREFASLLVVIDHIENPLCREDIIKRLTNNANKVSMAAFEHITGVKLAKAIKDRELQIENITVANYKEPTPYKSRKTGEEGAYSDTFYTLCQNAEAGEAEFVECRGKLWKYMGYDFFVQKHEKGYFKATEGKTGVKVADNCPSVEKLQNTIKENMEKLGDDFDKRINSSIEKHGMSPLYSKE
jgi:hypothetical protein